MLSVERESPKQAYFRLDKEGKIRTNDSKGREEEIGNSLRERLSSENICFVLSLFLFLCGAHQSMFEGYRKKPVEKKSL